MGMDRQGDMFFINSDCYGQRSFLCDLKIDEFLNIYVW